jgi:nitroreductase
MTFSELVEKRYSVRKYLDKPVEQEKLDKILEAARLAPTAANRQPQRIYVYQSEEAIKKIRSLTRMAYNAPIVLHICYDETASWTGAAFGEPDYNGGQMDAGIATSFMMMQATELGLGTLWVRGYDSRAMEQAYQLPSNIKSAAILLIGYADESTPVKRTPRKDLEEIVTFQ